MSHRHLCPGKMREEYDELVESFASAGLPVDAAEIAIALIMLLSHSIDAAGRMASGQRQRELLDVVRFGDAVLHHTTGISTIDAAAEVFAAKARQEALN